MVDYDRGLYNLINEGDIIVTQKGYAIPDSVTKIKPYVFRDCQSLTEITIHNSVTEIGTYAFEDCQSLTEITIPNSVTEIRSSAFEGCNSLTEITIPNSVTEIRNGAFYGCNSLTEITIPDSVTKIGKGAFNDYTSLFKVNYKGIEINHFQEKYNLLKQCPEDEGISETTQIEALAILTNLHAPVDINLYKYLLKQEHAHSGALLDPEFINREVLNFKVKGALNIDNAFSTSTLEELKSEFQYAHNGMYPKIIEAYALISDQLHIKPKQLVDTFELKNIKALLKTETSQVGAILADTFLDNNEIPLYAKSPFKEEVSKLLVKECTGKQSNKAAFHNAAQWILHHPNVNEDVVKDVSDMAKKLNISPQTTVYEIKEQLGKREALKEVNKIEEYYEGDFSFDKCKYDVKFTISQNAKHKAYIMKPDDARMVMLGYYTHCCQHLDGAGQDAMMHGLINPNAGFWVVENNKGEIIAQAEIWENKKGELVFDNIEFADDRDVNDIKPILNEWLQESEYDTVIMGCGYNAMNVNNFEEAPIQIPWVTAEELYIIGEGDYDSEKEANEAINNGFSYGDNNNGYTDADEHCVYLKKNGEISKALAVEINESLKNIDPIEKLNYYADEDSNITFEKAQKATKMSRKEALETLGFSDTKEKRTVSEVLSSFNKSKENNSFQPKTIR